MFISVIKNIARQRSVKRLFIT